MNGSIQKKPRKPRSADKLPFLYKVGIHLPPPPVGKIAWYDREKLEYVTFDSHAEMLRYALSKLLISDVLVDSLLASCPGKEWNGCDVSIIKVYYYGGYDYAEIVDYFKQSQKVQ